MTWNAVFPTAQTKINQSVTQIQANWAFINTFANKDHYFNSGTANEGYHKDAMMIVQPGDVAPAGVGANLALYSKNNTAGNPKLYDNTTISSVRQIPSFYGYGVNVAIGGGGGTAQILGMFGKEPCANAIITVSDDGGRGNCAIAYFNWDNAAVQVIQLGRRGLITSIQAAGTTITITASNAIANVTVQYMPLET